MRTSTILAFDAGRVERAQITTPNTHACRPLCLEDYSDLRALGRVALRDGGRTVAVGIVTHVTTE